MIHNVRLSNDNTYTCTISNDGDSVTSDPGKLIVAGMTITCSICYDGHFGIQSLPKVTLYPPNQIVKVTQPVKLTISVGKESSIYQWRHNGVDINIFSRL